MILLDTADVDAVRHWRATGVISGVTTNPTIMASSGVLDIIEHYRKLITLVPTLPVSVEVFDLRRNSIVDQAISLARLGENVVVKIPIHSADSEYEYLDIVNKLSAMGISINVTAIMSAQQAVVAALAGARYVSIFAGRVLDRGGDPAVEFARSSALIRRENLNCDIIGASVRHPGNISEWLSAGANLVTVPPAILRKAVFDARTAEVVQQFDDDAKRHADRAG